MNTVKHSIRLDLSDDCRGLCRPNDGIVFVKRGDDLSHELIVSLRNGKRAYIIEDDVRVYLYAKTAEGDRYLESCLVEDNEIKVLLKASMLDRSETVLEFRLVGGNGEILGTPALRVVVLNSEMYENIGKEFSTVEDYSALLRALRRAEDVAIAAVDIEGGDLFVTYGNGSCHKAGRVVGDKGERGDRGADGATWHYGTMLTGTGEQIFVPVAGAKVGDFYLNTDTNAVYVSTNGDAWWKYLCTLKGAPGKDGTDGAPGKDGTNGTNGTNGKDGISVTHSWNGTTLTVTSANGTSSADLKGDTGAAGANGKDGTSVTVKSVNESSADGGSNLVTFSDGKTLTIKNGSKGSKGDKGEQGIQGEKGDKGDKGDPYTLTDTDKNAIATSVKNSLPSETWTFTLKDGSTVTKKVVLA